jgi:hypothetical protein
VVPYFLPYREEKLTVLRMLRGHLSRGASAPGCHGRPARSPNPANRLRRPDPRPTSGRRGRRRGTRGLASRAGVQGWRPGPDRSEFRLSMDSRLMTRSSW